MWRTELWRWTVKNCGSSSIFPFKLRHKWAIRASYRNSMHWTLKPGEKKNSREEKAWKRLLQWPVKWSSDTCAIINSDRSGLKKTGAEALWRLRLRPSHKSTQSPEDPPPAKTQIQQDRVDVATRLCCHSDWMIGGVASTGKIWNPNLKPLPQKLFISHV